jgi:hypothetical protein
MKVMTITNVTNPKCGYLEKFKYTVDLNNKGVPSTYIEWCDANCIHHWGWHFWQNENAIQTTQLRTNTEINHHIEDTRAYMSFESYDEMILFKLCNLCG